MVMKVKKSLGVFCYGAAGYASLEILARGYTHWTMALAGGLALLFIRFAAVHFAARPRLFRAGVGALGITVLELGIGTVVNLWLGLGVWDYSARPGNLWGQVCPAYTLLWWALCVPAVCYFSPPRARPGPAYRPKAAEK